VAENFETKINNAIAGKQVAGFDWSDGHGAVATIVFTDGEKLQLYQSDRPSREGGSLNLLVKHRTPNEREYLTDKNADNSSYYGLS
jgi:hypothetical protein